MATTSAAGGMMGDYLARNQVHIGDVFDLAGRLEKLPVGRLAGV